MRGGIMSDWVGLVIAGTILVSGNWIAGAIRSYHPRVEQVASQVAAGFGELEHRLKKIEFWTQCTSDNTQK